MTAKRYLIVNADDFGQSAGVNRGIIEAHERGIVTSASLMVRWPEAPAAAAYGRDRPSLSLGLHIDLGEWVYRDEEWMLLYQVVAIDERAAVAEEVARQLATFRSLVGSDPTHIDSHQHVHLREPVRPVAVDAARKLGVPLRDCSREVRYCGRFYGQTAKGLAYPDGISLDSMIEILTHLGPGFTELGCHPAQGDDLNTMYRSERAQEVKALCDPRARSALVEMGIELCSFREVGALSSAGDGRGAT